MNALTYESEAVGNKFGKALDPVAHEDMEKAKKGRRNHAATGAELEKQLQAKRKQLERLERGEDVEPDGAAASAARTQRAADRAAARAALADDPAAAARRLQWPGGDGRRRRRRRRRR